MTLTSTTTPVCTVSGFSITLLTAGTCSITATQPGNAVYAANPVIARSFKVTKAPQTITIPDPGPQSMHVPTVRPNPSASSGLTVTLSTTTSVCTVSGDMVTLGGPARARSRRPGRERHLPGRAGRDHPVHDRGDGVPFVVASGDTLAVAGQPFSFHGAAIYGTSNPGAPNPPARIVALANRPA